MMFLPFLTSFETKFFFFTPQKLFMVRPIMVPAPARRTTLSSPKSVGCAADKKDSYGFLPLLLLLGGGMPPPPTPMLRRRRICQIGFSSPEMRSWESIIKKQFAAFIPRNRAKKFAGGGISCMPRRFVESQSRKKRVKCEVVQNKNLSCHRVLTCLRLRHTPLRPFA